MKHGVKNFLTGIFLSSAIFTAACYAADRERVYYRYTDEDGVQVLNHVIPPQYVNKGYEVVSINGDVLKVVAPAPTAAEAEKEAKAREARLAQEREDKLLRRRYSSVQDIEAAKKRSLEELKGNISILNSNLNNVRNQILRQQEQAASIERSGRTVNDDLLNNLTALQMEARDIQKQIKQREQEYETASKKFDHDMQRFTEISQSGSTSSATSHP